MPTAEEYHEVTSYHRHRPAGKPLDWANRPSVFKAYPPECIATTVQLPPCTESPPLSLPMVLPSLPKAPEIQPVGQSMQRLSNVIGLAAGITATRQLGGMSHHFRAWASAGGLFPCECYLALGATWQELEAGLWHYQPEQHRLGLLRHGDALGVAAAAAGMSETAPNLAGMVCITAIFHRSAWKYGERAYRYVLLDAGHLAENLLLSLRLEGARAMWAADFKDDAVNALLGVDGEREACLLMLPFFIGPSGGEAAFMVEPGPLGPFLDRDEVLAASACAPEEQRWPGILTAHHAGAIQTRFQGRGAAAGCTAASTVCTLPPISEMVLEEDASVYAGRMWPALSRTMRSRRSHRKFRPGPVANGTFQAFCHLLREGSALERGGRSLGLLMGLQDVEGVQDGLHWLDRERGALLLLEAQAPHAHLADACLGQRWMANAAVQVCCVANLGACEGEWGPRSYRALELAAGRLGQRVYLAATALGWGACGIGAYFDSEAAALLHLAGGCHLLYAISAGPLIGEA